MERKPVLRVLCMHGAADSFEQDWHLLQEEAPPDIEVATHEFPGHGHRKDEPFLKTLQELADDAFDAFHEAMDTGTFALLGHSIGCLMAILVARRARAELGVEPVLVIMMERGAAQFPLFTNVGADRLRNDPIPFFEYWNPMVSHMYNTGTELGQRTMDMWATDQIIDQEAIEVGYHLFKCPMLSLMAEHSVKTWVIAHDLSEDGRRLLTRKMEVGAFKVHEKDGRIFDGHFPAWTYNDWKLWTAHPHGCPAVECRGCDHMSIKRNEISRNEIWKVLRAIVDKF